MVELHCPNCNALNRAGAKFCSECGASLPVSRPQTAPPQSEAPPELQPVPPADALPETGAPQPPDAPPQPEAPAPVQRASTTIPPADRPDSVPAASSGVDRPASLSGGPAGDAPARDAPDGDVSPETGTAETGKVLYGRYNIIEELGRGGFGAVFRAWDANLNRPCAVKENLDSSPEASRQFAREASVLANLSHPNLPRVIDHFSIAGQGQYLVMDFVEGEDLDSLARRLKQLPVDKSLDWMIQVASALEYLHTRTPAVVHRDIKPSNIRVTPDGRAMLVDFGLVKMADPLLKTTMGARAVTPGYAPPEQYGMGRTDPRTDVYALGATLYKILGGREPLESVLRVAGQMMQPVAQLNPQVPPALAALIEKAMALDPARRFQSAAEMKAALQVLVSPPDGPTLVSHAAAGPAAPRVSPVSVPPGTPPVGTVPPGTAIPSRPRQAPPASAGRPPSGPPPNQGHPPQSGQRPPTGPPLSQPAAAPARSIPWLWIAGGGVLLMIILCLVAGGGIWAMLGMGEDPTPTQPSALQPSATSGGIAQASTTPAGDGTPSSDATPSPVSSATLDAPTPEPTSTPLRPTPTPNPAFRAPDRTTFVHADDSEPNTLDPALSYTTGGLEVLMNIYETLIFYDRENPTEFVPQLALEVPSFENGGISEDGRVYTFHIRPDVRFHDGSLLTPEDVAYTFRRNLLQGGSASPMLLLTEPFLGVGVYDVASLVGAGLVDNPQGLIAADPARRQAVCQRVVDAIQFDNAAGTVTFNLAQAWAPFLPTLAGGWGAIRSKAWTVANGGWDGECATWHNYYAPTLEEHNDTKLGVETMGTGPYKLESWKFGEEIVLAANDQYWRAEPAWPGGPSGAPALKRVTIRYFDTFNQQVELVKSGGADSLSYGTNTDWAALESLTGLVCELDDASCEPSAYPDAPLESIRGYSEAGRNWDIFFNQNITAENNTLIGSGKLDGAGISPDFFANVYVRRGFASCFNYDTYLQEVLQGEGERSVNVMLPGMIGYDPNSPYFTYDPARCEQEFRQAVISEKNVWDTGFTLALPVPPDSPVRRKIAEIFQKELGAVNPRFKISLKDVSWNDYNQMVDDGKEPLFHQGWLEDLHDPHNWVVPYTVGNQAASAHMPASLLNRFKDIVNRGVIETDPQRRAEIYAEFNQLFYDQVPGILLFQTGGRQYQQRWVRGWYHNPMLPGLYFYALSKD